jgi:hypothetical protein
MCLGIFSLGRYVSRRNKSQTLPSSQISPTLLPSTTPISGTWITYTSPAYDFKFQYPELYRYQDISREEVDNNDDTTIARFMTNDGRELTVAVSVIAFTKEHLHTYAPTGSEAIDPESVTLGNTAFYYYGPGGGGVCYPDRYFTNLKGKILVLSFSGCDNDKTPSEATKKIEIDILSTFQII